MNTSEAAKIPEVKPLHKFSAVLREKFAGKNKLIAAALLVVGSGMMLNWGWLTAVGIAPLILAILPCAVMCALGLCVCKMTENKSSGSDSAARPKITDVKQSSNQAI